MTVDIIMWRQRLRLVKQAAQEEKRPAAAPVFLAGSTAVITKGRKAAARAGGTGCSGP